MYRVMFKLVTVAKGRFEVTSELMVDSVLMFGCPTLSRWNLP